MLQWNANRYDVWASLARDMLPIMASSVSSERAFSSAGITISKRRNRLKPDVVEALQFLKCSYHHNLLFREEASTHVEIEELEDYDVEEVSDKSAEKKEKVGWDGMVEDLADNEGVVTVVDDDGHDTDNVVVEDVIVSDSGDTL